MTTEDPKDRKQIEVMREAEAAQRAAADKPTRFVHVTFAVPARVMLQDKSTPLAAVTCTVSDPMRDGERIDPNTLILATRWLFPVNGKPVKASIKIIASIRHIVSMVEAQLASPQ